MAKPSQYTEEDKYKAAVLYYLYHNFREVERQTGIAWSTVKYWSEQGWWVDMMEHIVRENRAKIRSAGNELIKLSMEAVKDRLENGDVVLDKRNQQVRKPVALRDALLVSLSWLDKTLRIDSSEGYVKETPAMLKDIARDLENIGKKITTVVPSKKEQVESDIAAVKEEVLSDIPEHGVMSDDGSEPRQGTS